jgi:two-component system, NarL family, response regulator NreC
MGELHSLSLASDGQPDEPTPAPIEVVLADDHPFVRHGLGLLLEAEEDLEVIGEADDLDSTVRGVDRHKPLVLALDPHMAGASSGEIIATLHERSPDTRVVILTMEENPAFAEHALACGAVGFVAKEHADSELPQAIRAAARGERYVSPRVAARLHALGRAPDDGER